MAIDRSILRMLTVMQKRYALGRSILVFGVQDVMLNHDEAEQIIREQDSPLQVIEPSARRYSKSKLQELFGSVFGITKPMHLDDLLRMMKFDRSATMDVFDSENPTIVHDLNVPVPTSMHSQYDVVMDIGVMEHVFDVKQCIQNFINLTKQDGVLIIYVPMSGWHNECFYNFQPPFFFDVFAANGFSDISVYLHYFPKFHNFRGRSIWRKFEYGDRPRFIKKNYFTHILMVARKTGNTTEFRPPLQSFYEEYHRNAKEAQAPAAEGKPELSHYLLDNMPTVVRWFFPVLVPVYRALPLWIRAPIIDMLMHIKNRAKLADRETLRL